MSKIFISYRRDDSAGYARSLYRSFEQRWGRDRVFMDIDSIAPGDDFEEVIERFLKDCTLVVVLIGKSWARLTDRAGRERSISDSDDFPHMEVAAALKRKIRVIPLLVGGATVPEATDLPEDLRSLRRRNAVDLRDRTFERDVEELMGVVDRLINDPAAAAPKAKEAAERQAAEGAAPKAKEAVERASAEAAAAKAREAEREARNQRAAQGPAPATENRPDRAQPARETAASPKPSPWPKIAGAGVVVAALAGLYMYQSAQEEARLARAEVEAQRAQAELAEARAKEVEAKAQLERSAREQAELERKRREQAERERTEKEAERQRVAAAQAEQQRLSREKAEREREARDRAERERQAREKAAREAEARAKAAAPSAPYDLDQLDPQVRAAVMRARDAERRANAAAARARDAAERARASAVRTPRNGLGIDSWATERNAGDEFAGYFENGQRNGVGVFSFGQNPNNSSNSLRYEGEWAADKINGVGVWVYRNGIRYAGSQRDGVRVGPGVMTFPGSGRYEGEYNDKRSGHGVFWDAQGRVQRAGIWTGDNLTTPLGPQGR